MTFGRFEKRIILALFAVAVGTWMFGGTGEDKEGEEDHDLA